MYDEYNNIQAQYKNFLSKKSDTSTNLPKIALIIIIQIQTVPMKTVQINSFTIISTALI